MIASGDAAPPAELLGEAGEPVAIPRPGALTAIVFFRGDWCPWCNGQLAQLARDERLTGAGLELAAVSVDPPARNRATRIRLRLPFPLLSDPEGSAAIVPYGAWDAEGRISRPAAVVVDPGGVVRFTQLGAGFAERVGPGELLAAAEACR